MKRQEIIKLIEAYRDGKPLPEDSQIGTSGYFVESENGEQYMLHHYQGIDGKTHIVKSDWMDEEAMLKLQKRLGWVLCVQSEMDAETILKLGDRAN